MDFMEKAVIANRKRGIVKISVVGAICVVGALLGAYNIYMQKYIYAILYFAAVILGLLYVIIKINTVMPAYLGATRDTIYMQCWENGAFAYKVGFKPAFLADFIPAKVKKYEIAIQDIKSVMIGNKNYLTRNLESEDFNRRIESVSEARKTEQGAVRKMDFIAIVDKDHKVYFMPVTDMEQEDVAKVINLIHRKNPEAEIKCNLREIRQRLTV